MAHLLTLSCFPRVGQLYLPIKSMCTTKFMVQVLEGNKRVFHSFEIDAVNVPGNRYTSKKRIAKMVAQHADLKHYFPDNPMTQCDRQFMLDIINTKEPAFFKKVIEEYERATLKAAEANDKVVQLDLKMYNVLN